MPRPERRWPAALARWLADVCQCQCARARARRRRARAMPSTGSPASQALRRHGISAVGL